MLASCQATAFTPAGDLSVTKALSEFCPRFASLFDGEPIVLPPISEGAPPEVPRIILESRNHEWRCELLPERANVFWRKTQAASEDIGLSEFFEKAVDVLLHYAELVGARVGRLSAVATRFAKHETPGLFLARHFCKERWDRAPLNRPENFELHAHKRFALSGNFQVNSWARSKTGKLATEADQTTIVVFEQDINTLSEESSTKSFTAQETKGFFQAARTELDTILHLYYPET